MRAKPWGTRWPRFSDRPGTRRRGPLIAGNTFSGATSVQPQSASSAAAAPGEETAAGAGAAFVSAAGRELQPRETPAIRSGGSDLGAVVPYVEPARRLEVIPGSPNPRPGSALALPRKSA
jgi:hypothetical protein